MCGICGFVGKGDDIHLSRMMQAIIHRGPDGEDHWKNDDGLFLGHTRLSILDLEMGRQPMLTPDKSLVVVFNGEIYNHKDLRSNLEGLGHKFVTKQSDTEVLLHGYRQWGTRLTDKLNGMWAFAIYDAKNELLWLSRDRFGKKPLFYSLVDDTFVFSSELNSIVRHPVVTCRIDNISLRKYFAYGYVPAPRSLVENVSKLSAGHNLLFRIPERRLTISRYWRYRTKVDDKIPFDENKISKELLECLYKAVATRLVADVPVGVLLSGGIDSSSIIALALNAQHGREVRTFSIGFDNESFDESGYSKDISKILGTNHTNEVLSIDGRKDLVTTLYSQLDEPIADPSLLPSFLVCKLAKKDVVVLLGGDGSDEIFAGYDPFKALKLAQAYRRIVPRIFDRLVQGAVGLLPVSHDYMSFDFRIKKLFSAVAYKPELWNPIWLGTLPPTQLAKLFGEPIDLEELYSEAIDAWNASTSDNLVDQTSQFFVEMYLQNGILSKIDRAGMLNSVEVRSPFLDKDFVDLVQKIPAINKFDGQIHKKILKKSLEPLLPVEILHRRKQGFSIPIGSWFRSGQLQIDSGLFDSFLDRQVIEKVVRQHVQGRKDERSFLWAYHVLEQWQHSPINSAPKTRE